MTDLTRRDLLKIAAGGAAAAAVPLGSGGAAAAADAQATAPRVARLGDSITQFAEYAQVAAPYKLNRRVRGAMTWVKTLFPAFNDDVWHYPPDSRQGRHMLGSNHGLAGDHTEYLSDANPGTLRRWIDEVAPMDPDIVLLSVGTNNLNSRQPATQLEADLAEHVNTILAAGARLALTTVRPRSGVGPYPWNSPSYLTDTRYDERQAANQWVNDLSRTGLTIADVNPQLEDPTSRGGAGGDWLPAVAPPDGVHPGALAAWAEASALLPLFQALVPAANVYGTDPSTAGNLVPNGDFSGVGGGLGAGITGQCADGWSIIRTAGDATAVASKVVESGVEKQLLTITPGTVDTSFIVQTTPAGVSLGSVPDGSWLRFHLNQRVSTHPGWKAYNPRLSLRDSGSAYTFQASALEPRSGELMPRSAWSGWPATHPVQTTPADATAWCSVVVTVAPGATFDAILTLSRAQLRVIPDPRPAWI